MTGTQGAGQQEGAAIRRMQGKGHMPKEGEGPWVQLISCPGPLPPPLGPPSGASRCSSSSSPSPSPSLSSTGTAPSTACSPCASVAQAHGVERGTWAAEQPALGTPSSLGWKRAPGSCLQCKHPPPPHPRPLQKQARCPPCPPGRRRLPTRPAGLRRRHHPLPQSRRSGWAGQRTPPAGRPVGNVGGSDAASVGAGAGALAERCGCIPLCRSNPPPRSTPQAPPTFPTPTPPTWRSSMLPR